MYQNSLLICMIGLSNFVYSSLSVSIAFLGDEHGLNYRLYAGIAYILSLVGMSLIYKFGNYSHLKRDLTYFCVILIIGINILSTSGFKTSTVFYGLMIASLCLIGLSSIGVHLYALVVYLLRNITQAIVYFPLAELSWDVGSSVGPSLLLILDESTYFAFVYLAVGGMMILTLILFRRSQEELELEWSPKDLPYNELRYDAVAIIYVLLACTSLGPVIYGVVEELTSDDETVIFYLISSTISSFLITIFLMVFLERLEVKFLNTIGICFSTLGMILVGPLAFLVEGNLALFSIGLLFLELGESIGTGSGFASLYQTVQARQEVDAYVIWVITAIYLYSLVFARIFGPWLMLWLVSYMDYQFAACMFAGIGVVVNIFYYVHFRNHLQHRDGELKPLI